VAISIADFFAKRRKSTSPSPAAKPIACDDDSDETVASDTEGSSTVEHDMAAMRRPISLVDDDGDDGGDDDDDHDDEDDDDNDDDDDDNDNDNDNGNDNDNDNDNDDDDDDDDDQDTE
jgi:hypothetical protein